MNSCVFGIMLRHFLLVICWNKRNQEGSWPWPETFIAQPPAWIFGFCLWVVVKCWWEVVDNGDGGRDTWAYVECFVKQSNTPTSLSITFEFLIAAKWSVGKRKRNIVTPINYRRSGLIRDVIDRHLICLPLFCFSTVLSILISYLCLYSGPVDHITTALESLTATGGSEETDKASSTDRPSGTEGAAENIDSLPRKADPLTGLIIQQVHRKKELCQRHIEQLFIRGEQVALVALFPLWSFALLLLFVCSNQSVVFFKPRYRYLIPKRCNTIITQWSNVFKLFCSLVNSNNKKTGCSKIK